MRISARNDLEEVIVDVHKGTTTAHVKIELKGGHIVTASITNESVDELGLVKGKKAYAVIKTSDVMVAIELAIPTDSPTDAHSGHGLAEGMSVGGAG